MRKDLFIVGVRLLGLWQLVGALNSFAALVATSLGFMQLPSSSKEYNAIHFLVELLIGIALLLRTHELYNFLSRLPDPGAGPGEEDDN